MTGRAVCVCAHVFLPNNSHKWGAMTAGTASPSPAGTPYDTVLSSHPCSQEARRGKTRGPVPEETWQRFLSLLSVPAREDAEPRSVQSFRGEPQREGTEVSWGNQSRSLLPQGLAKSPAAPGAGTAQLSIKTWGEMCCRCKQETERVWGETQTGPKHRAWPGCH